MVGTPTARPGGGGTRSSAAQRPSDVPSSATTTLSRRGSLEASASASASAHGRSHGGALATIKSYYKGTSSFSLTDETDRWSSSDRSPHGEQPFVLLESGSPASSRRQTTVKSGRRRLQHCGSSGAALDSEETKSSDKELAFDDASSDEDEEDEEETEEGAVEAGGHRQHRLQYPPRSSPRVLTSVTLLALCYFVVGGGPESAEQVIVAAGPLLGLCSLVAFPLLYFYPMAFTVTELVSAIPEAGGHAYWIAAVFGPRMGLQAGYWSWVSNCVDCAIYSSMSIAAIYRVAGLVGLPFLEFVAKATLALLLALPGFFDLRVVGSLAASLAVFVLVPYAVRVVFLPLSVLNES
jgi:hypothetical protein